MAKLAKLAKATRKMTFVFDSSSLIAFLWNEDGADVVEFDTVAGQGIVPIKFIR